MKIEEIIAVLNDIKADYNFDWQYPDYYYVAINEAVKYLNIFKDMFEGAEITNHKENDNEYTAI